MRKAAEKLAKELDVKIVLVGEKKFEKFILSDGTKTIYVARAPGTFAAQEMWRKAHRVLEAWKSRLPVHVTVLRNGKTILVTSTADYDLTARIEAALATAPCPFCGAYGVWLTIAKRMKCPNCGIEGPTGKTDEETREMWNRRAK